MREKQAALYSPEMTGGGGGLGWRVSGAGAADLPQIRAPPCGDLQLKISVAVTANAEKVTRDAQTEVLGKVVSAIAAQARSRWLVPEG